MSSNINENYPVAGQDNDSQGFRDNFAAAKVEIEALQTGKVDVVVGKSLSTEDYATAEKSKLAGIATNATANASDAALLDRANHTGSQAASTVAGLQAALDAKIASTEKGAANGVATLGADSKIPTSQLPALAVVNTYVVNSQAAQLALSTQEGDVVVRTDLNKTFIRLSTTLGTMADWQEMLTPTDTVLSVNGLTGAVTLTKSSVGLGNADNTSDADKPVSTAQQTALDLKAPVSTTVTLDTVQTITANKNEPYTALTAGATVTPDAAVPRMSLTPDTTGWTLAAPTNAPEVGVGRSFKLVITQGTTAYEWALATIYKPRGGGTAPSIATASKTFDMICDYMPDGSIEYSVGSVG